MRLYFVVLLIVGTVWACSSLVGDDGPSGEAWLDCKEQVEWQLNYPASADFSWMDTAMEESFISGSLTATNAFGVPEELRFRCGISGDEVTSVGVW